MHIRPIPYRDLIAVSATFHNAAHFAFLDGASGHDGNGRFSYLAADPFHLITGTRDGLMVNGKKDPRDPFVCLQEELARYAEPPHDAPAPFNGGAIGYFGYELAGRLERLPAPRPDRLALPECVFGFYDVIAAFDHQTRDAWIFSSGFPEGTSVLRKERAEKRAEVFAERIAQAPERSAPTDWKRRGVWRAELSRAEVERRIARIIAYVEAGDIFQANFTQRFLAERPEGLDDFTLYRRLRELTPAPFATFLRAGTGLSLLGASPERFLLLNNGWARAEPIKGTRPRDADPLRDRALGAALQESVKDRAENLMIVDLMRNDLSRVCEPGSVKVPQLCALESFASVHHLISAVTGYMRPGMGAVDLLRASFPGGSVTGAPKIRAMEIIHELEPAPRGAYCGCLGWIGFDGAMDMSMTIRTLTLTGDTVVAQAGGGIVADSQPAAEYEESMTKITPLLKALAGGGP